MMQNSQGCNALLDAAADVDQLCCWLPELDDMTPVDDTSSSLSDWMVGLSPRLYHDSAAAHHQAGTLGAPPSALKADIDHSSLHCQAPLGSPMDSSSAGNSCNSGSCSMQGGYGQLTPGVPQQHQATFRQQQQQQQQQQLCVDYCCPPPYSHMYSSSDSLQHGPVDPSGCWTSGFSTLGTDAYAAAGPSSMAPGAATANYYTAGPYAPAAPYPGPAPGSCLPAAAAPPGPFDQGFPPYPAFATAGAAFQGVPAAGYSCGPVSYPTTGPFTGGLAPMQAVLPGSCAGPCCAYPPAACMDSGHYYCPAAMPAQGPGFLSQQLAGQHGSPGLAGRHCSSRSSMHQGPGQAPATAGGGGGCPAAGGSPIFPAASPGTNSPCAAAAASCGVLTPSAQHTFGPGSPRKQPQQQRAQLAAPAAAARPAAAAKAAKPVAARPAAAAKAAKPVAAAAPKVKSAGAAGRMVQSGGVSKPAVRGAAAAAAKPLVSKAVKRKLLEEQQQYVMLDSAHKIKELADRKQKLSAIAEQLQESRDRAAAALAKLRGQYETMTADNARLRADNAEILALINDLKARLNVSA